jgi:hypothetical protein
MRFLSTCARTLAVALHLLTSLHGTSRRTEGPEPTSGFGVKQTLSIDGNDAIDPTETLAAKFAVMHNAVFPYHGVVGCDPRIEGST